MRRGWLRGLPSGARSSSGVWPVTAKLARWPLGGPVPAGWENWVSEGTQHAPDAGGTAGRTVGMVGKTVQMGHPRGCPAGLWVPGARAHLTQPLAAVPMLLSSACTGQRPAPSVIVQPPAPPTGHPMTHWHPSPALDLFFSLSLLLALLPVFPCPCLASRRNVPVFLFPSFSPDIQKALVERRSPKTQVSTAPLP